MLDGMTAIFSLVYEPTSVIEAIFGVICLYFGIPVLCFAALFIFNLLHPPKANSTYKNKNVSGFVNNNQKDAQYETLDDLYSQKLNIELKIKSIKSQIKALERIQRSVNDDFLMDRKGAYSNPLTTNYNKNRSEIRSLNNSL